MKELQESVIERARDRYYPILADLYSKKRELALTRYAAFVIGGVARNGKDQWIEFMNEQNLFANVESSIDPVKDVAKLIAMYEKSKIGHSELATEMNRKSDTYRELLFQLKKAWVAFDDGPNRITMSRVWEHRLVSETSINKDERAKCCFIHCREPEEINKWIARLEDSGFICASVCVRGHSLKEDFANHADSQTESYNYDIYVDNIGDLQDLRMDAYGFKSAFLKAFNLLPFQNPYQELL